MRALLGALALSGAMLACASRDAPRPNILLIVIDTLRADRLGSYGCERGLTPFLDSLARRSFVFERAYAQSSWTNSSVASLLTSRYPSQHGVTPEQRHMAVPASEERMLAEVLRENGYVSGAFLANGGLRGSSEGERAGADGWGFAQGFHGYAINEGRRVPGEGKKTLWRHARAKEINRAALKWLRDVRAQDQGPVFLYLHYMEPHKPYAPPAQALARVGRDRDELASVNFHTWGIPEVVPAEKLQMLEDVYDAQVASVDGALRALFLQLAELQLLDNAIVVVTADHGEEFQEHGAIGHGSSLYETLIRIPLILNLPGQTGGTHIQQVVSHIDIAPTLLQWIGAPTPQSFEGVSFAGLMYDRSSLRRRLASWLSNDEDADRPAFSQLVRTEDWRKSTWHHNTAVITSRRKLISGDNGAHEYYDLSADPDEQAHGALTERERESLQQAVLEFRRVVEKGRTTRKPNVVDDPHLDKATKERLRALGYVQ